MSITLIQAKEWLIKAFGYARRIAELEARVTHLEKSLLEDFPYDVCPSCRKRTLSAISSTPIHDPYKRSLIGVERFMECPNCEYNEMRAEYFIKPDSLI